MSNTYNFVPPSGLKEVVAIVGNDMWVAAIPATKNILDVGLESLDKNLEKVDWGASSPMINGMGHLIISKLRYLLKGGNGLVE